MSNTNTNFYNDTNELRLLISSMSNSPIPENFTTEDLQEILRFVEMIFITDLEIINRYGEKQQQYALQISSKISDLITKNQSIETSNSVIEEIANVINSYHSFKKQCSNSFNLKRKLEQCLGLVKTLSVKLENSRLFLEDNLEIIRGYLIKLQNYNILISKYILAGEIKIFQVQNLCKAFDNGDCSIIKSTQDRFHISKCMELFKNKITSLKLTQSTCLQYIAILQNEETNNARILSSIIGILRTTIPAFEEESLII